jgi:hypothetical protein
LKPILFSTPMVQAIQAGRKTMTRRVIKIDDAPENWKISLSGTSIVRTAPYDVKLSRYNVGDILWVRETWADVFGKYEYRADYSESENTYRVKRYGTTIAKWRPPIHMPREATRIFLRVTEVRVERLQDISYDDCLQEGMHDYGTDVDTLGAFQDLWQKLNAKRGYGWDKNPWVWVYEFERVSKDEAV